MRPSRSPSNNPLVTATFSNKKKGRSRSRHSSRGRARAHSSSRPTIAQQRDEVVLDDDRLLDIVRSLSGPDSPDDIIDIQERYISPNRSRIPFAAMAPRHKTNRGRSIEARDQPPQDSDDDVVSSENASSDDDERENMFTIEQNDSLQQHESYIERILERLHFKDVFGDINGSSYPKAFSCHGGAVSVSERSASERVLMIPENSTFMKMKLQDEDQRIQNLERKLAWTQQLHEKQTKEHLSTIAALQSKLAMQENVFASQLAEVQKQDQNQESRDDNAKYQAQRETYWEERMENEALREHQNELDNHLDMASMKISELEQKCADVEAKLVEQKATTQKVELELKHTKELLKRESPAKDKQGPRSSEPRVYKLLTTERQKVATLTALNERMKVAMRKLNNKIMEGHDNKSTEVEELRRQLRKRDDQIDLIKGILTKTNGEMFANVFAAESESI